MSDNGSVCIDLGVSVRLILVQFSFSNEKAVPASLLALRKSETPEQRMGRKVRPPRVNGQMVVEPTEMCSILEFVKQLETAGYTLVDVACQQREDTATDAPKYQMIKFIFARRCQGVEVSENIQSKIALVRFGLVQVCSDALWRVRVFRNPFYKDDKVVLGQSVVNVNLEARRPFRDCHGQAITHWQTDANGQRIGDAPISVQAEHYLRIEGEKIVLQ